MALMDLVFLAILIFGGFRGYKKGIIMEVFSILALVLAVVGAFKLLDWGIVGLTEAFGKPHPFIPFLSFILLFIVIILGVNAIGKMTQKLIRMTVLGWADRSFGVVLGVFKWMFALSLVLWIFQSFLPDFSLKISEGSEFYPYIMPFSSKVLETLRPLFPFVEDFIDHISHYLN